MDSDSYYAEVQAAYDQIASEYDTTVSRTLVSRRAKNLAVSVISRVAPPRGSLLDVGCYTGQESLQLAQRGFRVVGVDLSPRMVELSRAKAKQWRLADRTQFEVGRASDLSSLERQGIGPFDTAYSVYGTLNLEPRIDQVKDWLIRLIRPNGALVVGLLNPTVLYELLLGPIVFKFDGYRKLAKSRVRIRIGLGDRTVTGFLYTPREFQRLLAPEFSLEKVIGVHILYRPPRPRKADGEGLWWMARALDLVERHLENHAPFSSLGFFSLMVFRRLERSGEN